MPDGLHFKSIPAFPALRAHVGQPDTARPSPGITPLQRAFDTYKRLHDAWNELCRKEEDAHIAVMKHYPPFPAWLTYYVQPDGAPPRPHRYDLETVREVIKKLRADARQGKQHSGAPLAHWKKIEAGIVEYKAATDVIDKAHGIFELRAEIAIATKRAMQAERRMLKVPPRTLNDVLLILTWLGEYTAIGRYDYETKTMTFPAPTRKHDFDEMILLTLIHHLQRATADTASH